MNHIGKMPSWRDNLSEFLSVIKRLDVVGFYFLEGAKNFKPEKDLEDFLAAGPPPIYIGFGSVVVEDAAAMTRKLKTLRSGSS